MHGWALRDYSPSIHAGEHAQSIDPTPRVACRHASPHTHTTSIFDCSVFILPHAYYYVHALYIYVYKNMRSIIMRCEFYLALRAHYDYAGEPSHRIHVCRRYPIHTPLPPIPIQFPQSNLERRSHISKLPPPPPTASCSRDVLPRNEITHACIRMSICGMSIGTPPERTEWECLHVL